MANTYSQIYLHFIFVVRYRESMLKDSFRGDLHRYMTGIVQKKGHKLIAINSVDDHAHIFIGFDVNDKIPDLVRDLKKDSTNYINDKNIFKGKFYWQTGYGVFSYSHSQIDQVVKYIQNQQIHHQKKTFREEYIEFLEKYCVDYNTEFLFNFDLE